MCKELIKKLTAVEISRVFYFDIHIRAICINAVARVIGRTSVGPGMIRLTADSRGSKVKEPLVDSIYAVRCGSIYLVGP